MPTMAASRIFVVTTLLRPPKRMVARGSQADSAETFDDGDEVVHTAGGVGGWTMRTTLYSAPCPPAGIAVQSALWHAWQIGLGGCRNNPQ
jgi:hypothetical protein